MRKCKVCGKRLRLEKEYRYEVLIVPTFVDCFSQRTQIYECFDCPRCGCQNVVSIREKGKDE